MAYDNMDDMIELHTAMKTPRYLTSCATGTDPNLTVAFLKHDTEGDARGGSTE